MKRLRRRLDARIESRSRSAAHQPKVKSAKHERQKELDLLPQCSALARRASSRSEAPLTTPAGPPGLALHLIGTPTWLGGSKPVASAAPLPGQTLETDLCQRLR